jgi:hypothetical protein
MLRWLNKMTGRTYTNLPEAQQAYATLLKGHNWSSLAQAPGGYAFYRPTLYVSADGNDSNDGLTPGSAIKTITKVNALFPGPGAVVAFRGGDTFSGKIQPVVNGTAGNPVIFTSYGVGRAIINGGTDTAFISYGLAYVGVDNLDFVGAGPDTNTVAGCWFGIFVSDSTKLAGCFATNCSSSGFKHGFLIGSDGPTGSGGFDGMTLYNLEGYGNENGAQSYGSQAGTRTCHTNLSAKRLNMHDNRGNGAVFGSCKDGSMEESVGYNNGALINNCVGLWFYNSDNFWIRYCESYSNKSPSTGDGGGFDIDTDCVNCGIEFSYAHGNMGPGFMMYEYQAGATWQNNTIRYCISESDSTRDDDYGAIRIGTDGAAMTGIRVYNNVFYQGQASRPVVRMTSASLTGFVENNVLYMAGAGGKTLYTATLGAHTTVNPSNLIFRNNDYWAPGGLSIVWNGSTYSTVAAWRAAVATQETVAGSRRLAEPRPAVRTARPGRHGWRHAQRQGGGLSPAEAGSPLMGVGRNTNTDLGVSNGTRDFTGGAVPHAVGTGYNVGADGSYRPAT